ncbi:3-keto-5-aminohexanoate cleavage protein [Aquabacter sp. P-9]|uniref:3-keto-5-aminohexanoate cleavage protein n=1 Tax=Aquabacter sediminis TaxID=3029197 RepID=UPI00237D5FCD|nr:3-keto-5-aminohexanoate cleavage protein [Aquabacter sp. P-9]MDE1571148.1 3-keto-5-aminohexanoate cleavage protein [Aquabacter sp. P-9]
MLSASPIATAGCFACEPDRTRRVMISVAPNGGRKTKADHSALPLSADELACCAIECRDAAASLLHLHVRDRDGRHLLDADAYRAATEAVRRAVGRDLVVQITTESLGFYGPAEQIAIVKAVRPESASIAMREIVPEDGDEGRFSELLAWMRREGVTPQIILYDLADQRRLMDLQARGVVPGDLPLLFVLGRYTANQSSAPADILPFLQDRMALPAHWSVCAFGAREAACVVAGTLLGGHVRVGFENNLFLPSGAVAPSNAALVAAVTGSITALGFGLESADSLRQTFSRLT